MSRAWRRRAPALAATVAFAALCAVAARDERFAALERRLSQPTVPMPLAARDRLRDRLHSAGLLHLQPPGRAGRRIPPGPDGSCPEPELGPQPVAPEAMPSSRSAPPQAIATYGTVASLWIDPCRIRRLRQLRNERGRHTEELAWLSIYEDGVLRFASPVGVRLHGRFSRQRPPFNFRLYFRSAYGEPALPASWLDGAHGEGLTQVVVKRDTGLDGRERPWPFVETVAFEIGRRLGAFAPHTRYVAWSLNGAAPRPYHFMERFSPARLEQVVGPGLYLVVSSTYKRGQPGSARLAELVRWVREQPPPLQAATVGQRFDLEALTASLLTALVAGTGDPFQDALARDTGGRALAGRWFPLLWDHDLAFRDEPRRSRFRGRADLLELLLAPTGRNDRIVWLLLHRLLSEDPTYRTAVARRLVRALNHELRPEVLAAIVDALAPLHLPETADDDPLKRLRDSLARRPAELVAQAERWLGAAPIAPVEIVSEVSRLSVDGREAGDRFRGFTGESTPLELEIGITDDARFEGWFAGDRLLSTSPRFVLGAAPGAVVTARVRR